MKNILVLLLSLYCFSIAKSQSITQPTIGSTSGQFINGNVSLSYTVGESFVGMQSNGGIFLGSGFWTVVAKSYVSSATFIYRFSGSGNFNDPANWQDLKIPPNPLPGNSEIIIDPVSGGKCVLNVFYTVGNNAKISVVAGAKFVVPGNLIIQKP